MNRKNHITSMSFKHTVPAAAILAVFCAAAPGAMSEPAQSTKTELASSSTMQEVKEEWREAMAAIKGYSAEQRDEALEKSKALIDSIDTRIEALEARAADGWDGLAADMRAKRRATLKTLHRQRTELAEWYGGMKHSSGEAWDDVKDGFVDAYDKLANAFSEASSELN